MKLMWRCPTMMEALKNRQNACAKLVRSQFEKGGAKLKSDFQLPEPWTGLDPEDIPVYNGVRRVPLLFLTDCVPLRENEPDVPTLSHDYPSYHSFYTRRFASRLGEFQLPEKDEPVHAFGHVVIRRSEGNHGQEIFTYYEPQEEESSAGTVNRVWTSMARLTSLLLDETTLGQMGYEDSAGVLGKHSVIMPLAHCKAAAREGVLDAIPECVEQHTIRMLRLFQPRLVVVPSRETLEGMVRSGLLSERQFRRLAEFEENEIPLETVSLGDELRVPVVYDSEFERSFQSEEASISSSLVVPGAIEHVRKLIALGTVDSPLVEAGGGVG